MSLTQPRPQHADTCARMDTHTHTAAPPSIMLNFFRLSNVHSLSCQLAVPLPGTFFLLDLAYCHSSFSSQFPHHSL